MNTKPARCLFVTANRLTAADLANRVAARHGLELVNVSSRIAATALLEQADIAMVMADVDLPGGGGLSLLRSARNDESRECFAIGKRLTRPQLVEALRMGVSDVFEQPLDLDHITDRLAKAAESHRRRRHDRRRHTRLRDLSTRIIRDRREIRRRVDVVCRDLVGAYRQLAEKVVSIEQNGPADGDGTARI